MNNVEGNGPAIIGENNLEVISMKDSNASKEKFVEELNNECNYEKQEDSIPEVLNKNDQNMNDGGLKTVLSRDAVGKLAGGLLSIYVDDLQSLSGSLTELTKNQSILTETIQQENTRFLESTNLYHLDDLFMKAKHYHSKLQQIKKEMTVLHERSIKLKKRALKLQQLKQREALQREQQRERELEHEKHLIPKVVSKS